MHRTPPAAPRRLVFLAALALGACTGGDDAATLAWQTVTDTIGDTIVVRTVGASDSAAALRLVEELRIGEFEGGDEYGFGQIGAILPAPDGGAYVWDQTLGVLRQYAADGRFVRQIGRKGSGPGEYQDRNGLAQLPDGRLALWDAGNTRVTFYDTAGAHVGEFRATSNLFGWNGLQADTAGRLYLYAFVDTVDRSRPDTPRRQGFVVYDGNGTVLDSIAAPPAPEYEGIRVTRRQGNNVMRSIFSVPYVPQSMRVLGPHGHYASAEGSRYAIVQLPDGAPPLRIERDVPTVAVEPDDRENQTEILTAQVRRQDPGWRWTGPAIPDTKPMIRSLSIGADGRLWVMRSMPSVRADPAPEAPSRPGAPPPRRWREPVAYDVFEPDGSFVGHLPMPRRTSVEHMQGERVWGVVTDSLDVPYVVRFRLERATPPAG